MSNLDKFISELNATGIAYIRDGLTFSFPFKSLYLRSLTTLPEGVTLSAGGYLDLGSLTTLPEGVTLSAGDYLDLGSLTTEEQRYQGKKIRLRVVDHTLMRLISKRAAGNMILWSAQYFKGHLESDPRCWIAQDGDTYAHGDTPEAGMLDLRFKVAQRDLDPAELVAKIKARGTIEFNDYRLLTGACAEGLRQGLKDRGLDPDLSEMPLDTALKLSKGAYGGDTFARLMADA